MSRIWEVFLELFLSQCSSSQLWYLWYLWAELGNKNFLSMCKVLSSLSFTQKTTSTSSNMFLMSIYDVWWIKSSHQSASSQLNWQFKWFPAIFNSNKGWSCINPACSKGLIIRRLPTSCNILLPPQPIWTNWVIISLVWNEQLKGEILEKVKCNIQVEVMHTLRGYS